MSFFILHYPILQLLERKKRKKMLLQTLQSSADGNDKPEGQNTNGWKDMLLTKLDLI